MPTATASQLGGARQGARKLGPAGWIVAVVALALIVRVVVVLTSPHYVPRTDAADYDRIAVSLVRAHRFPPSVIDPHGGPSALRPPLFPAALAAVYKLVGVGSGPVRWEAGRLLEAVLGALTVALISLIARGLWGAASGLLCGAIAAVYPPLVAVGSSLMTESLFIPLVLATVFSALVGRGSAHRLRWAALTGVLLGLAALTRGNGIVLLLPVAFLLWGPPRRSARSLIAPLIAAAAALLTLVPWTVRNLSELHELVPISTEPGYAAAGTFNTYAQHRTDFPALWLPPVAQIERAIAAHPNLNEAQLADRMQTVALDYATAHPTYVLEVLGWSTLRLLNLTGTRFELWAARYEAYPPWLAVASVYAFWVLGALALVGSFTPTARTAPWALWGCPAVILLSTVLFEGATRYRAPADPFVIMLAAAAVLYPWRRVRRGGPAAIRIPSASA